MKTMRALNKEKRFYNGTWESAQRFKDMKINY